MEVHKAQCPAILIWKERIWSKVRNINLTPDSGVLNISVTQAQRSYVGCRDFGAKKVHFFRNINLTQAGYGTLCLEQALQLMRDYAQSTS